MSTASESTRERIALLPGSYDPITKGHVALALRASKIFDRVIVAVMRNSEKQYLFSMRQRLCLAEASLACVPNCSVIGDEGLLIDLYARIGATAVVKGVRNAEDLAYENAQAAWNREHLPGLETVYLPAFGALGEISSTRVREALKNGKDAELLLMPEAARLILSGEIYRI